MQPINALNTRGICWKSIQLTMPSNSACSNTNSCCFMRSLPQWRRYSPPASFSKGNKPISAKTRLTNQRNRIKVQVEALRELASISRACLRSTTRTLRTHHLLKLPSSSNRNRSRCKLRTMQTMMQGYRCRVLLGRPRLDPV